MPTIGLTTQTDKNSLNCKEVGTLQIVGLQCYISANLGQKRALVGHQGSHAKKIGKTQAK